MESLLVFDLIFTTPMLFDGFLIMKRKSKPILLYNSLAELTLNTFSRYQQANKFIESYK